MLARVSPEMSLSSHPSPVMFLSGNHSKASKPFLTANSNGAIRVAAEYAVWLPIFIRLFLSNAGAYLRPRLDHIEPALRIGPFDVLGRTKGAFNFYPDPAYTGEEVFHESIIP